MYVVLSLLLTAAAMLAPAQGERLRIAACSGPEHQLLLIGPPDLLTGQRPLELPPGVGFRRFLFVRESLTLATVHDDDPNGAYCRLQAGHLIALQRLSADRNVFCLEPWTFLSILALQDDLFVLPQDPHGDICETFMVASS